VLVISLTRVTDIYILVAIAFFMGISLYSVRPVLQSWMMDMTPDAMRGTATSGMFGVQSMMSATAPVIGGFIADTYGLQATFFFLACTMLSAMLATSLVPADQKTPAEQETPA